MGCEQLHEGFFSDLIDVISGIKDIRKEKKDRKAIAGYTSLAKATSNLICVFPVLLSRNIPIGTAQIVTKACERDDTSMLQILFSALSISQASDGIEYVKSVHRNMKLGSGVDVDEFMRVMNNSLMTESSIVDSQTYDLIRDDMKNINYTLPDSISERGLNGYSLIKEGYNYLLLEDMMPDDKTDEDEYGDLTFPTEKYNDDMPTYADEAKSDMDLGLMYFFKSGLSDALDLDEETDERKIPEKYVNVYMKDRNGHFILDKDTNDKIMIDSIPYLNLFCDDKLDKELLRTVKYAYNLENPSNDDDSESNEEALKKLTQLAIKLGDDIDPKSLDKAEKVIFDKFTSIELKNQNLNKSNIARLFNDIQKEKLNILRANYDNVCRRRDQKRSDQSAIRQAKMDRKKHWLEVEKFRHQMRRDHVQDKKDQARAYQQYYSDLYNRNSKMLIDTDVKKANEMMPTLLNVSFTQMVNQGDKKYETPVAVSMIIGVKAKMVPLDSGDIINRIINKNKDKNFFIKFFRSTTREISFFKDLVFSVDKAKSDALSFSKKSKSSGIWKLLERRSGKSKAARLMGTQNSAMAISTLIITAEEVETIKKIANINVEDPSVMAPIMQAYNLMGFGIVDDTLQTFKIMRDNGENYFETYAYTALEKELADNTKAVANLVAASNRK